MLRQKKGASTNEGKPSSPTEAQSGVSPSLFVPLFFQSQISIAVPPILVPQVFIFTLRQTHKPFVLPSVLNNYPDFAYHLI